MTDERDPVIRRAIDTLRELPESDRAAIDRVVAAAAAARMTPAEDVPLLSPPRRGVRGWVVGVVAAAAVFAGFMLRGVVTHPPAENTAVRPAMKSVQPVAATAEQKALPVMQQFVFNSQTAHRVSVVGDFNGWNAATAPMSRSPDGSLWSTTIPIAPGRHIFGFMVDDSIFVLDPSAPKARDPDLGAEGSVVIVGRP